MADAWHLAFPAGGGLVWTIRRAGGSLAQLAHAPFSGHAASDDELKARVCAVCSAASVIACVAVLVYRVCARAPPKFPSSMFTWRIVCDLLLSAYLLASSVFELRTGGRSELVRDLAFIAQFGAVGSLSWYKLVAVNLHLCVTRPFTRPAERAGYYHAWVWTSACLTAALTTLSSDLPRRVHWVRAALSSRLSLAHWLVLYGGVTTFSALSWLVVAHTQSALHFGGEQMRRRLSPRQNQMHASRLYSLAFTIYWSSFGFVYALSIAHPSLAQELTSLLTPSLPPSLLTHLIFSATLGLLGIWDVITGLAVHRATVVTTRKRGAVADAGADAPTDAPTDARRGERRASASSVSDDVERDITDALRREFVRHTIVGIVTSTRAVNAEAACSPPSTFASSNHRAGVAIGPYASAAPRSLPQPLCVPLLGAGDAPADMIDPLIPQLTASHFAEVATRELSPRVYFQDFAPMAWQALRQTAYEVSFAAYLASLMGDDDERLEDFVEAMAGNFSEGRSGGFFFSTADGRYILKTIERHEQRQLLAMLPQYYDHLRAHPRSLLCRYYGCYALTMHSQCRYFVVMESLFFNSESIHEKYDLKGSWVDRRRHVGATYLDLDMRRKLFLPTPVGAELLRQCTLDVALLRGLNIMDYSLLLGVHVAADGVDVAANGVHVASKPLDGPFAFTSLANDAVYYVCVIDLLQPWDVSKRLERLFKVLLRCRCRSASGMSAIEPTRYADRFVRMVERILNYA